MLVHRRPAARWPRPQARATRVAVLPLLAAAGLWAGIQNALAGGGSFVTLPALILAGVDPRAANITSTVALFPGQVVTGASGRSLATGAAGLSLAMLVGLSLVGGIAGALLLLATPSATFAALLPWLVLAATGAVRVRQFRALGWTPDTARLGRQVRRPPRSSRSASTVATSVAA